MEKKLSRRNFLKGFAVSVMAAPIVALTPVTADPKPIPVAGVKATTLEPFSFDKPKSVMKSKPSTWEWFTVAEVQEMERIYPAMLLAGAQWEEAFARYVESERL